MSSISCIMTSSLMGLCDKINNYQILKGLLVQDVKDKPGVIVYFSFVNIALKG